MALKPGSGHPACVRGASKRLTWLLRSAGLLERRFSRGLASSRTSSIIPNAVHLERIRQAKSGYLVERYGLAGKRVLMTLGRLPGDERYKGQDRIITLLPLLTTEFPNLTYLIAGEGNDRARLEALVDRMGLRPRVVFTGKISEIEKTDHFNLADAFAMPSLSEG